MSEQTTAVMWATDIAELTGCDQIVWVRPGTPLPEAECPGERLSLEYPEPARREQLELQLRGSMAGCTMYAVPLAPGLEEPWRLEGLLLTDDPGAARWFADRREAAEPDGLGSSSRFLRVLHLIHTSGRAMAAFPSEQTLWSLGGDVPSICRAISLGLGSYEGRWSDWLTMPLTRDGTLGILSAEGLPHWLQIGPDGKLWAADPWADSISSQGLKTLLVAMPELCDGLVRVSWPMFVHCAAVALSAQGDGVLGMEPWYYDGIVKLMNQWAHTEDVLPRVPQCYVGNPAAWPVGGETEPCPLGQMSSGAELHMEWLQAQTAKIAPTLTNPANGKLCSHLAACLEQLRGDGK